MHAEPRSVYHEHIGPSRASRIALQEMQGAALRKDSNMTSANTDLALVMTGGRARAAYQVGFLRCIARRYPDLTIPLARELWLDAKLKPHVPIFTTIMQCSTSMIAVFEAAGCWVTAERR
ncbi:MAG: hypothetical protein ACREV4_01605 [Gammaproteobacteria bacterium]